MTQAALAEAIGVSTTTVTRWESKGIPGDADQKNMDAFKQLEADMPRDRMHPDDASRIAAALVDLSPSDLADLLVDVKRRQLAALMGEFGPSEAPLSPDAVQDRARRSADNGEPNSATAG